MNLRTRRLQRSIFALLLLFMAEPRSSGAAVNVQVPSPQAAGIADSLFTDALTDGPVYIVPIEGMIDNVLATYVQRAVDDAEADDAALIIFHVDTFGGLVDAADGIRKTILSAEPTTVAFIDRNAASAGALISYATDCIVMVPGASIGAATVVQGGSGEAAPDKYQSYMRGLMRSTAEAKGRDPRIAEAMVDENLEVEGVSPAGQVLTLSAVEARSLGVADAVLADVDSIIEQAGISEARLVAHRASATERALRFLSSPVLQSLLMLMMMGGLYFELQTPGVGFAGSVAAVGAALFFAPHYMMGLVESWEIVLFGIGVVLLLAEIFVIPGFGVAGIGGLILVVGSLFAALVGNVGFTFPPAQALTSAVVTMAVTLVLLLLLMFSLGRYLPKSERFNQLVLAPELSSVSGYVSADTTDALAGRTGVTLTPLRPSGTADIDGDRVDVIAASEFIPAGTTVQVVRVRGSRVEVRRATVSSAGETSAV
jgi:membrane-bound serine protease (ClpP class)